MGLALIESNVLKNLFFRLKTKRERAGIDANELPWKQPSRVRRRRFCWAVAESSAIVRLSPESRHSEMLRHVRMVGDKSPDREQTGVAG